MHGEGGILECDFEKELLINMLCDDQRSQHFFGWLKQSASLKGLLMIEVLNTSQETVKLLIVLGLPFRKWGTAEFAWHFASASQWPKRATCFPTNIFRFVYGIHE